MANKYISDDIDSLRRILSENRTIAMVGLSAKWHRPSNFAAKYMQEHGYRVIPVNPAYEEVLGEKCYRSLPDIPFEVDVVDVFRRPEDVPAVLEQAIQIKPKVFWMQIGVINEEATRKAHDAGMEVVMDRCMKIEHARLFGGLHYVGVYTGVISSKRPKWLPY